MKKLIITLCLATAAVSMAAAQSTTQERNSGIQNKKGQMILPQQGDFGFSIDAQPIVNFLGNTFNNTVGNSFAIGYNDNIFNNTAISAKYFLTDNTAVRVKLHLGFNTSKNKNLVRDDVSFFADPTSQAKAEDVNILKNNGLGIRVGYEMRRGYGRLQGFYGGEAGIGFNSSSQSIEFANALNITHGGATSTNNFTTGANGFVNNRTTEIKNGTQITGMIGGFAGVEYFFARKMSISAEANLALTFSSRGKGESTSERINAGAIVTETNETRVSSQTSNSSSFSAGYGAGMALSFYF